MNESKWYSDGTIAVQIDTVRSFAKQSAHDWSTRAHASLAIFLNTKHGQMVGVYSSVAERDAAFDKLVAALAQLK